MILSAAAFLDATMLIVDHEKAGIALLELVLGEAGYTNVSSTMNPAKACALHRQHRYDLILLDLQLPGTDGFQVMEALKSNVADEYLPVIVLTARQDYQTRALRAGARDFICKPFDPIEVKTRIHNNLEVRLLYRKLADYSRQLEQTVMERTAELHESEARFRSLAELASDWYWEQDESGNLTKVSGLVEQMFGIRVESLIGINSPDRINGWDKSQRAELLQKISSRQPFLDFVLSRVCPDGSPQAFRVSGQPMFNQAACFIGYRGVGVEVTGNRQLDSSRG